MTTTTVSAMAASLKAKRSELGEPEDMFKDTDVKIEVADRSEKEGYISFDEICGFKTGINAHFRSYKKEDWDETVANLIPPADSTIKLDPEFAYAVCMVIEHNQSLLAYGPPGTGKTVTPREVCARIGYPFLYIQGMGGTEPADFIGNLSLERDGESTVTGWNDGVATYAVRHGAFLLYDEPFKSSAQTNMCFQSLIDDRRELKLYGYPDPIKATLKANPNFRICLCDNVRGVGDSMGKYAAEIQDQSTMDRVDLTVNVGYPAAKDEVSILRAKFPTFTDVPTIEKMVKVANLLRVGWAKDNISLPFTMRKTQNWIKTALETGDVERAFRYTYYNSLTNDEELKSVKKAYQTVGFTGL